MKKLFMGIGIAAMVMGMAAMASAAPQTDWYIQFKIANSASTAGPTITVGTKAGASDGFTTVGSEDTLQGGGAGARGIITSTIQPLATPVAKDIRAAMLTGETKTWNLEGWLLDATGVSKTAGTMTISAWLVSKDLDGTVKLSVNGLGDSWSAPIGTTSATRGTSLAPLKTWTYNYDGVNNLAFNVTASTVPEPGSMVAMLSGLAGLVGFGIRRRK